MEEMGLDRAEMNRFCQEDVLVFPDGLPGFPDHQRFSLVHPHELAPLVYLQSLEPPQPRFILVPAALVDPGYQLRMEPRDRDLLFPRRTASETNLRREAEISLYFVISVAADRLPTVNMLAPIVIRPALRLGVQAVRGDARYSHAYPLLTAYPEVQ